MCLFSRQNNYSIFYRVILCFNTYFRDTRFCVLFLSSNTIFGPEEIQYFSTRNLYPLDLQL